MRDSCPTQDLHLVRSSFMIFPLLPPHEASHRTHKGKQASSSHPQDQARTSKLSETQAPPRRLRREHARLVPDARPTPGTRLIHGFSLFYRLNARPPTAPTRPSEHVLRALKATHARPPPLRSTIKWPQSQTLDMPCSRHAVFLTCRVPA